MNELDKIRQSKLQALQNQSAEQKEQEKTQPIKENRHHDLRHRPTHGGITINETRE